MPLIDGLPLLPLRDALLFAAACGFASHLVFNKFEPYRVPLLILLLGVFPSLPVVFLVPHFATLRGAAAAAYTTYYAVLGFSVVTYRISPFHPLARYPGPFLAKITQFRGMQIALSGKRHVYYKELHERYGPYVRVGPNELSFLDVDAIAPILGLDGMPKGPSWDGRRNSNNVPSLIAMRDSRMHAKRRQIWNKAFNTAAVKDYEPIIIKRALQLAEELEKHTGGTGGGVVDLAQWMSFFGFDFMGDMAFGGGFEFMRDGDKSGLWHTMEQSLYIETLAAYIPWARVLNYSTFLTRPSKRFRAFAIERSTSRKQNGSHYRDLFHHLIDEDGILPIPPTLPEIISDAGLAIIGGSDTTSLVMSNLFYYLLANPNYYTRLREEVDSVFPSDDGPPFDSVKLAEMPFLNAAIDEAMRLQPALASGSQRAPEVGSGGKAVGNHFIPEGTAIFVPTYAIHRDPRYFSPSPDKFWPERWLPTAAGGEKFTTNHAAYMPFSYGPANCPGRRLALVEMRMVVCLLMQRFDMRFEALYDPAEYEKEFADFYVLSKGRLPVVLTQRKGVN